MRAFRLLEAQRAELCDVPAPDPAPGEVVIRIGAAGACRTDLDLMAIPGAVMPFPVPFTLGHEIAGWVESGGAGDGLEPGAAVAVSGVIGCGRCRACLAGAHNACLTSGPGGLGIGRDGGMAEFVAVPAGHLVPVGDLPLEQAAPLTDAGLTPYHAVRLSRDKLVGGSTAVVIGIGGLGHMAIQILRAVTPAQIVAVSRSADRLALARELGADEAVVQDAEAPAAIRELSRGIGADLVIDCVGSDATLALAAAVVATGGDIQIVGAGGGSLAVGEPFGPLPLETRVMRPFWGTRAELLHVIELARAGKIAARIETFGLDRVQEAYARLAAGEVDGRAVVVP